MATTTTNFGWDIPQSTDLVKDGATAIAALGQDIDTALVDLKGGTTGQVLAKASGTDLDFSWVAQDDSNAIQNAIVDAKGDLIAATAADTPARLAVGTNGTVLTADSAEATGLKWAAPASGGLTLLTTLSPSGVADATADNIFTSTYDNYIIEWCVTQSSNAVGFAQLRSGGTNLAANYTYDFIGIAPSTGQASWSLSDNTGTGNELAISMKLYRPAKAEPTMGFSSRMATVDNTSNFAGLVNTNSTAYDGIRLAVSGGTMTGKIRIYGLAN
jgi:hypothetical protein